MNWFPLLFLLCGYCQGWSGTSMRRNRTRRTLHPLWKPAARKAYDLCGPDLKDHEKCKMPPWCAEGGGRCCRGECICPTRLNPCGSLQETTTTPSTTTTKGEGQCMLECMLKCYKACRDETETSEKCKNKCSAACFIKCAGR
uniref:Putative secreted peptide n=1 Tax=Rhipicephalus pulchellus TaxID=72859 RepID=L7MC23_RHIPC